MNSDQEMIEAMSALAQPSRLAIMRLLIRDEIDGLPAGEIAARVGARQNTTSVNLAILGRAGLVMSEPRGRHIHYSADLRRFRAVMIFLAKDCCQGRLDLCPELTTALGHSEVTVSCLTAP